LKLGNRGRRETTAWNLQGLATPKGSGPLAFRNRIRDRGIALHSLATQQISQNILIALVVVVIIATVGAVMDFYSRGSNMANVPAPVSPGSPAPVQE
jgi:hypothetical protein